MATKKAAELISEGDSLFVDGDYSESILRYTDALNQKDSNPYLAFVAYSHRSESYLKLKNADQAFKDANSALKEESNSQEIQLVQKIACLTRLGNAAVELQQYENAIHAFEQTLQMMKDFPLKFSKDHDYLKKQLELCRSKIDSGNGKAVATSKAKANRPTMPKYQYYQNDSFMTIAILEPNVQSKDLNVDFSKYKLSVTLHKKGVVFTVCHGYLYDTVNPDKCKIKITDEKVLVKLKKVDAHEWNELFGKPKEEAIKEEEAKQEMARQNGTTNTKMNRPYASNKDWNSIERDLKKQEATEKPEGDEALNKLFKNIYADANDDTRRAMIKSYQTSGGTVLSTNWNEVSQKNYEDERQAPKGMEWKNWEGDRLPQKDDD